MSSKLTMHKNFWEGSARSPRKTGPLKGSLAQRVSAQESLRRCRIRSTSYTARGRIRPAPACRSVRDVAGSLLSRAWLLAPKAGLCRTSEPLRHRGRAASKGFPLCLRNSPAFQGAPEHCPVQTEGHVGQQLP